MKIEKIILAAAVAFGANFYAQAADQGQGKVTFKGSIIDAPCSISSKTANQEVDLGSISNVALKNSGKSTAVDFSIDLEQCDFPTSKTVKATFTGASSPVNTSLLGITGTASGAGVVITYGGKPVKLGQATTAQTLNPGNNTLHFAAYLQGEGASAAIVPGNFTAVADFTLAYQ
ncbi:TPA: fimbrial protein [Serratia marcescens]